MVPCTVIVYVDFSSSLIMKLLQVLKHGQCVRGWRGACKINNPILIFLDYAVSSPCPDPTREARAGWARD